MKAYCPHKNNTAMGQAVTFPSSQGLAHHLAHALFPFLMDSRLQTELEWKPTSTWQFCPEPTGIKEELDIEGLLQLNDPFQGQGPNVCCFPSSHFP